MGNEYQAALLKADFEWYVEDVSCLIPPKTGDPINIILWTVLALSSLMLIVLLVLLRRRKNEDGIDKNISKPRTKTRKKVISSIVVIVALLSMLVVTTYALFSSFVSVDDNLFQTGTVQIELNGGKPIFDGSDMNIEPGHTLVRNFTVENKGSAEVYVRLYLENVQGDLQDVLTFSIYDGDTLLFSGSADEWTREASCISDTPLSVGEIRTLTAIVKMDESATNSYQMAGITFDMTADAVQSKIIRISRLSEQFLWLRR